MGPPAGESHKSGENHAPVKPRLWESPAAAIDTGTPSYYHRRARPARAVQGRGALGLVRSIAAWPGRRGRRGAGLAKA